MDALSITAIITGLGGLAVAVFTHIKYSKCYGFEVETREEPRIHPSPCASPCAKPCERTCAKI